MYVYKCSDTRFAFIAYCGVLGCYMAVNGTQNTGHAGIKGCVARTWAFSYLRPIKHHGLGTPIAEFL